MSLPFSRRTFRPDIPDIFLFCDSSGSGCSTIINIGRMAFGESRRRLLTATFQGWLVLVLFEELLFGQSLLWPAWMAGFMILPLLAGAWTWAIFWCWGWVMRGSRLGLALGLALTFLPFFGRRSNSFFGDPFWWKLLPLLPFLWLLALNSGDIARGSPELGSALNRFEALPNPPKLGSRPGLRSWLVRFGAPIAGVLAFAASSAGLAGFDTLKFFVQAVSVLTILFWGRFVQLPASRAREIDTRPPVLFLRSFRDNSVFLRKSFTWRGLFSAASPTVEQVLALDLSRIGPVVTIGKPGETFVPEGAVREYVPDETWQTRVSALIGEAALVAGVAGETEGVAWEFTQVAGQSAINRLLIVFPPVKHEVVLVSRWTSTSQALGLPPECLPLPSQTARPVAAVFPEGQLPVFVIAPYQTEIAYRLATRVAVGHLLNSRLDRTVTTGTSGS